MAAPVIVDLTKAGFQTEFSESSPEDISYAKTFWQSVQLQPPMESRLVSSDIKQRLKVAPSGSHNISMGHLVVEQPKVLQKFLERAKTMERLEEYREVQKYAHAREQDLQLLQKHRSQRQNRESISRGKGIGKSGKTEAFVKTESDDEMYEEEAIEDQMKDMDKFEADKFGFQNDDSD